MKQNLQNLIKEGFVHYGNQGSNEVYKVKDNIVLYNPIEDKIICTWNLEELNKGLKEGDFSAIDFEL